MTAAAPSCDPRPFLEAIDDDRVAYAEMVDLFRDTGRAQIERLVAASRDGDLGRLRESLHALNGSLAIVNAGPALALTRRLHLALGGGDRRELIALAERLGPEFERVCRELDRWCPAYAVGERP
ncbi:MAG: Hpt domain-containing protein [Burkholderiales bacterium]